MGFFTNRRDAGGGLMNERNVTANENEKKKNGNNNIAARSWGYCDPSACRFGSTNVAGGDPSRAGSAFSSSSSSTTTTRSPRKRNVLLIIADDWRAESHLAYGRRMVRFVGFFFGLVGYG